MSDHNTKAFTLIELLVVISIIALLIGILLPTLSAAKKAATNTKCLSNLKQVGIGATAYTVDNQSFYPPASRAAKPTQIRAPYGISGVYDIRDSLNTYVAFNLLQCPFSPEEIDLELEPGGKYVETNYAFYWSWEFSSIGNTSNNEKMARLEDTFTYQESPSTPIYEFNVLAMDVDSLGTRSETSHPFTGAMPAVKQPNTSGTNEAYSRWDSPDGKFRGPISKNYMYTDGSVETFSHIEYDHSNTDMQRVPAFNANIPFYNFLPTKK